MFNFIKISPSILAIDYKNEEILTDALKKIENSYATFVHLDVMDGKFVPNKTFDEKFVERIKNKTDLLLDVHLMINNPEEEVEKYLKAGADILTVHYESCKNLLETLKTIKKYNCLAGVAICPRTPAIKLKEILRSGLVDIVVVMGVEPGDCGRAFIPGSAEKVAEIKELCKSVEVEVDGGVTVKNSKILRKLGATILVSGSTIFNSKDINKTIKELKGKDYGLKIRKLFTKKNDN
ncbi:MAG: ribulose-phosphate 3-epimerase [Christensenellales bacterium]